MISSKLMIFITALIMLISLALPTIADSSLEHHPINSLTATYPLSLQGKECKRIFNHFFRDQDTIKDPITPYDTWFTYPITNLEWAVFNNMEIKDWNFAKCEIDYNEDHHYYIIKAVGVEADIIGDFAYGWEPGMPELEDDGKFKLSARESTVIARIQRFQIWSPRDTINNTTDNVEDPSDGDNDGDDEDKIIENDPSEIGSNEKYVWKAFVVSFIPELVVKTSETKHAEFYDKLALKYNELLKVILSVLSNGQLSVWLNEYCERHDCSQPNDHIDEFVADIIHGKYDNVINNDDNDEERDAFIHEIMFEDNNNNIDLDMMVHNNDEICYHENEACNDDDDHIDDYNDERIDPVDFVQPIYTESAYYEDNDDDIVAMVTLERDTESCDGNTGVEALVWNEDVLADVEEDHPQIDPIMILDEDHNEYNNRQCLFLTNEEQKALENELEMELEEEVLEECGNNHDFIIECNTGYDLIDHDDDIIVEQDIDVALSPINFSYDHFL